MKNEKDLHIVPVRGNPRFITSIGTTRVRCRCSMFAGGRKSSGCFSFIVSFLGFGIVSFLPHINVDMQMGVDGLFRTIAVSCLSK